MSYDIALNDPVTGDIIELSEPHFMQGGTYAVGGTTEFWLNITYNYGKFYRQDNVFGRPLLQLLAMAKMRPDGIWNGD